MKAWISFDFDNTLIRNPYWRLHLNPWLARQARTENVDPELLWRKFRQRGEDLWRAGQWVESFDWTAISEHIGLTGLPDPGPVLSRQVQPLVFPYVEPTLVRLRQHFRLAIVTNGYVRFQIPYIKALGWDYLFDAIVGPDAAQTAKPNPEILAAFSPAEAHVGDRLTHDVLVAQRAHRLGILFIGDAPVKETERIDPMSPSHIVPNFHFDDFRQLSALMHPEVQERRRMRLRRTLTLA